MRGPVVLDAAGRRHRVIGRAAPMLVHVLARQERIHAGRAGSLTFHAGSGEVVKPTPSEE